MTREEIINGLKFTVDMFLFDPSTGDVLTKERLNEENRTTVEACECAIELLKQDPCEDAISREAALDSLTATSLKKFDWIIDAREKIKTLPSVTPIRPKGKWLKNTIEWNCSVCGGISNWREKFCPNCGSYNGEDIDYGDEI